jgi:hypothetical protein
MLSAVNPEDLNVAVTGALVGGVVAYAGGWLQDVLSRNRRRRSLATALLIELDSLSGHLLEIETAQAPSGRVRPMSLPIHDALLTEILLFRPLTVATVLRCLGFAKDLSSRLDRLQSRAVEPGPTWDHELKRLASILKQESGETKKALYREGGRLAHRSTHVTGSPEPAGGARAA